MAEKKNVVASLYDWVNAKPRTLVAALRNQKQINLYLNTQLEAKNKVIREIQKQVDILMRGLNAQETNYQHTNQRLTDHIADKDIHQCKFVRKA